MWSKAYWYILVIPILIIPVYIVLIVTEIILYRGVGTGLADPAIAGPKFTIDQESP